MGVAVTALRPKGDDNVRPEATEVADDLGDGLRWIRLIKIAVNVIQKIHFADAERFRRAAQLGFAHPAQRLFAGVILLAAEPATLAARGRDEIRFHTPGGVL